MPNCAVYGCANYNRKTKGKGIKYFSFPKNGDLAKRWALACGREDKINFDNARVCSLHFHKSSYQVPLQQQLLNYRPRNSRNLKADAVPTECLHSCGNRTKKTTQANSQSHQTEVNILNTETTKTESVCAPGLVSSTTTLETDEPHELEVQYLKNRVLIIERENCDLKLKVEELLKVNREILRKLDIRNNCVSKAPT